MTPPASIVPALAAVPPLSVYVFGRTWQMTLTPVFDPLWRPDGTLAALELLSRFTDAESGTSASPERFFSQASPGVQHSMLCWQADLLTAIAPWCLSRQVPVSLNLSRPLATMVQAESGIAGALLALSPYLRLEISERFLNPDVLPGSDPLLQGLRPLAPLWLDDFGAGTAGLAGLLSGAFDAVKVDRRLFCDLVSLSGGPRFLHSLTGLDTRVIVEGVETLPLLQAARDAGVSACQGWLWPEVTTDKLATLPDSLPVQEHR